MENTFKELDALQAEINFEKANYKKAIQENRTLGEVKIIYRIIKSLEKRAGELMTIANDKFGRTK